MKRLVKASSKEEAKRIAENECFKVSKILLVYWKYYMVYDSCGFLDALFSGEIISNWDYEYYNIL